VADPIQVAHTAVAALALVVSVVGIYLHRREQKPRLANTLRGEGYGSDVRLALEVADRAGNTWRRPFGVSVDLWAYSQDR